MTTPSPSHLTEIAVARNPSNDAVPQTSSKIDASAHTILDGVTSASITMDGNSTEISELGEAGVRRLLGRANASLDLDINLDPGITPHQDLIQDAKTETPYSVVIDYDQSQSPSDRYGTAFVAKIESLDGSADDGQITISVSFSLANGAEPLTKTITGTFSAETASTPLAAHNASIQITGDPIAVTGESTSNVSGNIYEIDDTAKDIWDPTAEVKVFENGVETTSGFTEQYLLGRIVFDSAPTTPVTVDVSYLPKYTVEDATNYSFNIDGSLQETTRLDDKGMRMTQSQYDFTTDFDSNELGGDTLDAGGTEDKFITVVKDGRLVVLDLNLDTRETEDLRPQIRTIGRFNTEDLESGQDDIASATYGFEASQFDQNSSNLAQPELYRFVDE